MLTLRKNLVSEEEYLEAERKAEFKSEYVNGEVFAMAGASRVHVLIGLNIVEALRPQSRGRKCEVYASDLRVRVTPGRAYTYPDLAVVCGDPKFADDQEDTLLNPTVIIEVLSESTRDYDLGPKSQYYRRLPSLMEYVTVEQEVAHVERWTRESGGGFLREFDGLGERVELKSIGCFLEMADIYEKVDVNGGE